MTPPWIFPVLTLAVLAGCSQDREVIAAIARLDSDAIEDRAVALERLKAMGEKAAEELRNYRTLSPDVKVNIAWLLQRIEIGRKLSARLRRVMPELPDILISGDPNQVFRALLKVFANSGQGELLPDLACEEDLKLLIPPALGVRGDADLLVALEISRDYPCSEAVIPCALIAGDRTLDAALRVRALESLARIPSETSTRCLVSLLDDGNIEVRERAIALTGEFGVRPAIGALQRILRGPRDQAWSLAVGALATLGWSDTSTLVLADSPEGYGAIRQLNATDAIPRLIERARAGDLEDHRGLDRTLLHFVRVNGPGALAGYTTDPDEGVRKLVLRTLASGEEWSLVTQVSKGDPSSAVREIALDALLDSGQAVDQAVLKSFLGDPDPRLRRAALRLPEKLAPETCNSLHATLLADPEPGVRHSYLNYLRRVSPPLGLEFWAARAKDQDPSVRAQSVLALPDAAIPGRVQELLALLQSNDADIAEGATLELAVRRSEEIAGACLKLYGTAGASLRARFLRILASNPEWVDESDLLQAAQSSDQELRRMGLSLLRRKSRERFLEVVETLLTKEGGELAPVWDGLQALGENGSADSAETLRRIGLTSRRWVRAALLQLAVRPGHQSSGKVIEELLRDRRWVDGEISAASALVDSATIEVAWRSMLASEVIGERLAALHYFRRRVDKAACPDLDVQLRSRFPIIRAAALECLVACKGRQALSAVLKAQASDHWEVRAAALNARVGGRPLLDPSVIRQGTKDPVREVRSAARLALVESGLGEVARDVFVELLADELPLVPMNSLRGEAAWLRMQETPVREGRAGLRGKVVRSLAASCDLTLSGEIPERKGGLDWVLKNPGSQRCMASEFWATLACEAFEPIFQGDRDLLVLSRSGAAKIWRARLSP